MVAPHKVYRPSRQLWVGIALVVRTVLMLFLSTGIIQDRIAEGESDVDGLTVGNFETSLRVRILMGQMALGTGLQAPLLG